MLLEDSDPRERGTGVRKHSPEERGTEVLERMEDLQHEGVNGPRSSAGAKLDKVSFTKANILQDNELFYPLISGYEFALHRQKQVC